MEIEMRPVVSSQVAAVGYDPMSATLAVEFHRSGVYHYREVPAAVFEALLSAESVGKTFNATVKGRFEFTKIGGA